MQIIISNAQNKNTEKQQGSLHPYAPINTLQSRLSRNTHRRYATRTVSFEDHNKLNVRRPQNNARAPQTYSKYYLDRAQCANNSVTMQNTKKQQGSLHLYTLTLQ